MVRFARVPRQETDADDLKEEPAATFEAMDLLASLTQERCRELFAKAKLAAKHPTPELQSELRALPIRERIIAGFVLGSFLIADDIIHERAYDQGGYEFGG
jgi:hypothetical protein